MLSENLQALRKMNQLTQEEVAEKDNGIPVPPRGKYVFGIVKVGDKGQIVIPKKVRKIFDIHPGEHLIVLGDETQGIAIMKEENMLSMMNEIRKMTQKSRKED